MMQRLHLACCRACALPDAVKFIPLFFEQRRPPQPALRAVRRRWPGLVVPALPRRPAPAGRRALPVLRDAKAAERGITNEEAKRLLLGEKEPSMQFTTPEELGELAVFFCSPAANNVRGVAWNMDGGWTAQ